MYERNAIIIERFFNSMFGYDIKNNIKTNFTNYCELIEALEKYKKVSEEEEEIIIEYDIIANRIRDIQRKQENLNKKNLQFQQERNELFQNIDEDANLIQNKLDSINNNIQSIDEEIKENAQNFTNVVAEFNEKTIIRTKCGKNRRMVEKDYNNKLNTTLDNYKNIDINLEKRAKQFIEIDTTDIEIDLKNKIQKNGENEKIPFKEKVIDQAIALGIDTQKRETDILSNVYEKTNKLFSEIKNNNVKMEKHKKLILDSKSKLEFIETIKEYMIQFLDNERLASVNMESEYNKLMEESCKNLNDDLVQINNLYSLLIKEISRKATKRAYSDLYNIEYLKDLEDKADEFEAQVKKLKLPVAVINPNYWRVVGMRRIYDVFNKCVTEYYDRDLSEFIPVDTNGSEDEDDDDNNHNNKNIKVESHNLEIEDNDKEDDDNIKFEEQQDDIKSEIDKKIDIILGLEDNASEDSNISKNIYEDDWAENQISNDSNNKEAEEEWEDDDDSVEEDFDEEDFDEDEWEEDKTSDWDDDYDIFGNNEADEKKMYENIDNEEDDDESEIDGEEDFDEVDDDDNDNNERKNKEIEDFEEEADYDIWGNNITKKEKKHTNSKNKIEKRAPKIKDINERKFDNDWENEFINIDKKDKNKKKSFFEKFIK